MLLPRVDTTARANHNGKAEPPPIPSNAANLTPWTKSNFLAVGKSEEAEAMHREALAMAKKLLGEEHP